MTWNYRVIKSNHPWGETFAIHEVYYDEDNRIKGFTENRVNLSADSVEELKEDIDLIKKAFDLPVLNLEDLQSQEN